MRDCFRLALLLGLLLIAPSTALAGSTQCICDGGRKMRTTSTAEDACLAACDLRGGGGVAVAEDEAAASGADDQPAADSSGASGADSGGDDAAPVRRRVVTQPAAPAVPGATEGTD